MQQPRVQEVWRVGSVRVGVLSGPHPGAAGRLSFWVSVGEDVGRCFIARAEALGLHQLTPEWVQRAMVNVLERHGRGEILERIQSRDGLEIRADDAADARPEPFRQDRVWDHPPPP